MSNQFGKHSTANEILQGVDLSSKTIVMTGATSGIGIATAKALSSAGANLVIGARNPSKLNGLISALKKENSNSELIGLSLDLSSVQSIDRFSDQILKTDRPVDILINNAGIIAGDLRRNADGIESQLMTNFLGHALLLSRLSGLLRLAPSARLVSLSSVGHHYYSGDFEDLNYQARPYSTWEAYGQSKAACALMAVHADQVLGPFGVRAFAVHPGAIMTQMAGDLSEADFAEAERRGSIPNPSDFKTPEQGSATTVWAAVSPKLQDYGGLYLEDCQIATVVSEPNYKSGVMRYAISPKKALKIWESASSLLNRELAL